MREIANTDIQKRIRRRKRRFRVFMFIILISSIVLYLFQNPVFKVKNVIVRGNNIVNEQSLVVLSGINSGDNLLKLNTRRINENILTNPYIESSKLRRTVFGNVYITIDERQGAAIVEYNSKYAAIDKKGIVMEIMDKKDGVNLPTIHGLNIKEAKPGKCIEFLQQRDLDTIIIIFDNIKKSGISDIINEIDIESLLAITLKTQYGINIKIGSTENIEYKLKVSKAIMEEDIRKKGFKGTLDVSFNGNPVFKQD